MLRSLYLKLLIVSFIFSTLFINSTILKIFVVASGLAQTETHNEDVATVKSVLQKERQPNTIQRDSIAGITNNGANADIATTGYIEQRRRIFNSTLYSGKKLMLADKFYNLNVYLDPICEQINTLTVKQLNRIALQFRQFIHHTNGKLGKCIVDEYNYDPYKYPITRDQIRQICQSQNTKRYQSFEICAIENWDPMIDLELDKIIDNRIKCGQKHSSFSSMVQKYHSENDSSVEQSNDESLLINDIVGHMHFYDRDDTYPSQIRASLPAIRFTNATITDTSSSSPVIVTEHSNDSMELEATIDKNAIGMVDVTNISYVEDYSNNSRNIVEFTEPSKTTLLDKSYQLNLTSNEEASDLIEGFHKTDSVNKPLKIDSSSWVVTTPTPVGLLTTPTGQPTEAIIADETLLNVLGVTTINNNPEPSIQTLRLPIEVEETDKSKMLIGDAFHASHSNVTGKHLVLPSGKAGEEILKEPTLNPKLIQSIATTETPAPEIVVPSPTVSLVIPTPTPTSLTDLLTMEAVNISTSEETKITTDTIRNDQQSHNNTTISVTPLHLGLTKPSGPDITTETTFSSSPQVALTINNNDNSSDKNNTSESPDTTIVAVKVLETKTIIRPNESDVATSPTSAKVSDKKIILASKPMTIANNETAKVPTINRTYVRVVPSNETVTITRDTSIYGPNSLEPHQPLAMLHNVSRSSNSGVLIELEGAPTKSVNRYLKSILERNSELNESNKHPIEYSIKRDPKSHQSLAHLEVSIPHPGANNHVNDHDNNNSSLISVISSDSPIQRTLDSASRHVNNSKKIVMQIQIDPDKLARGDLPIEAVKKSLADDGVDAQTIDSIIENITLVRRAPSLPANTTIYETNEKSNNATTTMAAVMQKPNNMVVPRQYHTVPNQHEQPDSSNVTHKLHLSKIVTTAHPTINSQLIASNIGPHHSVQQVATVKKESPSLHRPILGASKKVTLFTDTVPPVNPRLETPLIGSLSNLHPLNPTHANNQQQQYHRIQQQVPNPYQLMTSEPILPFRYEDYSGQTFDPSKNFMPPHVPSMPHLLPYSTVERSHFNPTTHPIVNEIPSYQPPMPRQAPMPYDPIRRFTEPQSDNLIHPADTNLMVPHRQQSILRPSQHNPIKQTLIKTKVASINQPIINKQTKVTHKTDDRLHSIEHARQMFFDPIGHTIKHQQSDMMKHQRLLEQQQIQRMVPQIQHFNYGTG